eukprot:CAMPEP_0172414636 /NCGR_PEP_ID=MMETSP1064-20121228/1284_1 /TAXON_ID=202472 /ORGANISM="Aulacoseira subarctica , Strain CCAP 1002/5" /LENGTH=264 /DNA_ID=CAMNT_0013151401 /DNA_START=71 /DNA_END=865 /DNA_ORIENTATION=+
MQVLFIALLAFLQVLNAFQGAQGAQVADVLTRSIKSGLVHRQLKKGRKKSGGGGGKKGGSGGKTKKSKTKKSKPVPKPVPKPATGTPVKPKSKPVAKPVVKPTLAPTAPTSGPTGTGARNVCGADPEWTTNSDDWLPNDGRIITIPLNVNSLSAFTVSWEMYGSPDEFQIWCSLSQLFTTGSVSGGGTAVVIGNTCAVVEAKIISPLSSGWDVFVSCSTNAPSSRPSASSVPSSAPSSAPSASSAPSKAPSSSSAPSKTPTQGS